MKIYVVTDGEYSDYHIEAVFTDKAKAKWYADVHAANVEEYDSDPVGPSIPPGMRVYRLLMSSDGDVSQVQHVSYDDVLFDDKFVSGPMYPDDTGLFRFRFDDDTSPRWGIEFACLARSEEHAVKIVNEWRIQMLAENRWTTVPKDFEAVVRANWPKQNDQPVA